MARSLDDSAAAALMLLELTKPKNRENLGALFTNGADDELQRSNVIESGQDTHVRGTLAIPKGSALEALYHNHPLIKGDAAHWAEFSDDDKAQARRLGIPSYISAGDAIRKFDPRTNKTADVLAEFPWNKYKGYLMEKLLKRAPDDPRGLLMQGQ